MNKKELCYILEKLNLPKDEYYILSTCALMIMGVKENANDLDLCVSKELFVKLKEKYNIDERLKNSCGFYKLNDKIEIVVNDKKDFKRMWVDGFPIEDINVILEFKTKRNLEKDKDDIKKIKEYLKNKD